MEDVKVAQALKEAVIDGKKEKVDYGKVYDHVQFQKCKVAIPLFEELDENSFYALTFNALTRDYVRLLSLYYPRALEMIKQFPPSLAIKHLRFYTAIAYYQLTVEIFEKFNNVKVYEDDLLNYDYRLKHRDLLLLDRISLFKGREHVGFLTIVAVEGTPMIATGVVRPKNVSLIPKMMEEEINLWLKEPLTREFFVNHLTFVGKEKINEYAAEVTLSVLTGRYVPSIPAATVRAAIVDHFHEMRLRLLRGKVIN